MDVYEKAHTPLAMRLSALCTDTKALAGHLGCTVQAVNQYKLGTAAPKIENLVKIARYYGVTADWLLGLSDVRTPNMDTQSVCAFLCLGEATVDWLRGLGEYAAKNYPGILDSFLGGEHFKSAMLSVLDYGLCWAQAREAEAAGDHTTADARRNEAQWGGYVSAMAEFKQAIEGLAQ